MAKWWRKWWKKRSTDTTVSPPTGRVRLGFKRGHHVITVPTGALRITGMTVDRKIVVPTGLPLRIERIPDITLDVAETHDMSQYIKVQNVTSTQVLNLDTNVATYSDTTKLLTGVAAGTSAGLQLEVSTANQILSQNFESDAAGVELDISSARVSVGNAHSGSFCLRGNLKSTVTDPITGLTGSGWQLPSIENINGSKTARDAMQRCYLRYWVRFDDFNWSTDDGCKIGYFWSDLGAADQSDSIWPVFHSTTNWEMGYNSNSGVLGDLLTALTGGNWGGSNFNFAAPASNILQPDGTWVLIEMRWEYTATNSRGNNYFNVWINGDKMVDNAGNQTDGDWDLPTTFRLAGFQFWHSSAPNVDSSTDGTGTAAGYQIDDIEIWDDLPSQYANGRW